MALFNKWSLGAGVGACLLMLSSAAQAAEQHVLCQGNDNRVYAYDVDLDRGVVGLTSQSGSSLKVSGAVQSADQGGRIEGHYTDGGKIYYLTLSFTDPGTRAITAFRLWVPAPQPGILRDRLPPAEEVRGRCRPA